MEPSPFVAYWIARLVHDVSPPRLALDVAMGRGRHALPLLEAGFETFGVDQSYDHIVEARQTALRAGLHLRAWVADLERSPLPLARFALVVCTNYLARRHWDTLLGAVRPGGFLICETFTIAQRQLGFGPTSLDHLLRPGELREVVIGWEILAYEEVERPLAQARLIARRPRS